jgi:hypothetical protein
MDTDVHGCTAICIRVRLWFTGHFFAASFSNRSFFPPKG